MLFTGMLLTLACTTDETPVTTDDDVVVDETVPGGDTDDVNGDANIVELASDTPELSTLVDAVVAAGLDETLSSDGDFTVFAPTNEAFEALGVDLDTLEPDVLAEILTYHVIAGARVDSGGIPAIADSVADYTLFFDTTDGVMVNNATVIQADVEASNGIVHVVDTVLLPPTIVDAAVYGGLNELVGAVTAADPAVVDLLSSPGDYTVFAPTDDAFADIADVASTLDQKALTDVLSYHVFPARVPSDAVPAMADSALINAGGYGVTALFDTSDGVVINGYSTVVIADIKTTNGIVHVVDSVLLPPNLVDHAVAAGLTSLLDTVAAANGNVAGSLSGPSSKTVFAPTNDAFADIADVAGTLNENQLRKVLLYHVVPAYAASGDVATGSVPTFLDDQTLDVVVDGGVFVNGAEVVIADVHATNGVVHIVDAVLIPEL